MKKLLIITDAWDPQINGVVTFTKETINILEKMDFQIEVIHPGLFLKIKMPLYPEIKLSLFPNRKISKIIKNYKPDFIHIATEGPLGQSAAKICRHSNLKYTTAYHTHFANYIAMYVPFIFRKLTQKIVYKFISNFHRKSTHTMVSTISLAKELEKHGVTNTVICPLGVNTNLFKPTEFIQNIDIKKPIFTYFGRVAKEKNVEAFFACKLPGTKMIIGDGPLRKKLETAHRDAVFVGYKKGQELVNWLSLSDVFVFPSKTDTFGLVIIEALATGIPVAGYDVMGPKDIITNGVDGFISDNLEDSAIKCLKVDRNNCRQKALNYSWENSTKAFAKNLVPTESIF